MIRMGLDGSTKCSGLCIFDDKELLCYGKIIADKELEWRERVVYMMKEVASLIREHHVQELCVELPVKTISKKPAFTRAAVSFLMISRGLERILPRA